MLHNYCLYFNKLTYFLASIHINTNATTSPPTTPKSAINSKKDSLNVIKSIKITTELTKHPI